MTLYRSPRRRRPVERGLCTNPDCFSSGVKRVQYCRALCTACYTALRRSIGAPGSKYQTWEDAARDGACAPRYAKRPPKRFPDVLAPVPEEEAEDPEDREEG